MWKKKEGREVGWSRWKGCLVSACWGSGEVACEGVGAERDLWRPFGYPAIGIEEGLQRMRWRRGSCGIEKARRPLAAGGFESQSVL